jgi:type IX secretion system PorP/SprF family membrane protein
MRKIVIALGFITLAVAASAQQDPQYSGYMFNQLSVNPAYAGSSDALSTSLVIRNQWTGIKGAPKTSSINVHGPLRKKKVGLALQLISDQLGPKTSNGILGSYAYRLPVAKGRLAMALRLGVFGYKYDWSMIEYKDPNDVYNTGGQENISVPTADAGLYYNSQTFYAGFSASHILHGRLTSYDNIQGRNAELKTHIFATAGKAFQVSPGFILNPSVMVKAVKNAPVGVDLNVNALIEEVIWLGVSVRKSYGFVVLAQYNISQKFKVGYAFDMGLNKIGIAGKGTHELLIRYDFDVYKSKTLSPRYM